jgi:hypothetical protein
LKSQSIGWQGEHRDSDEHQHESVVLHQVAERESCFGTMLVTGGVGAQIGTAVSTTVR